MKQEVEKMKMKITILIGLLLFINLAIFVCALDNHDRTLRDDAFEHSSGIVISKQDGHNVEFDRITVQLSYKSCLGGICTFDKTYLVSDDVFDAVKLGAKYDGEDALGYIKQYRTHFFGKLKTEMIFY